MDSLGVPTRSGLVDELLLSASYIVKRHGLSRCRILDAGGNIVRRGWLPMMYMTAPPVALPDGTVLLLGESGTLYCYQF